MTATPPTTATTRARLPFVLALGLLLALAAALTPAVSGGCDPPPPDATHLAAEVSAISPYGILTSPRWAYGGEYVRRDLDPVANTNPHPEPQPHRDHPFDLVVLPDGSRLYVTLSGTEAEPGHQVAVVDVARREVLTRVEVGSRPTYLSLAPDGRHLIVLNRYSNYASVLDSQTDRVVSEIPLDFYCQDIAYASDGRTAYVSNRYLDQVLVVDIAEYEPGGAPYSAAYSATVRPLGGYDEDVFRDEVHRALQGSCAGVRCHSRTRGGYYAGDDPEKAYLSAIENSVPGDPDRSVLLQAVLSTREGGFADDLVGSNFHAGGLAVWARESADYRTVAGWIAATRVGPGIPIGNFGSKPGPLAMGSDGRTLYVGNQGTTDIAVVDLERLEEVTAIYTQNIITDLAIHPDHRGRGDLLLATSLGVGFGAAKERDPFGGESGDPQNPAAQYSVLRDIHTTEPLPLVEQKILGPFDATDGTAASKMSDIQNDLLVIDTGRLEIPPPPAGDDDDDGLQYALYANRYEAHDAWVRYTSDSAEILPMDISGDIPPELQRVVGAFPEAVAVAGDAAFVVMQGSYELVEWRIDRDATEASERMEPVAVFETGIMPWRVAIGPDRTPAQGLLFVANKMGETVSFIDRHSGHAEEVEVGDLSRPVPDSDAERGEMFVDTCVFSVDGDTACASCHIYNLSDGRGWGAGQAIAQMHDGKFVNGGLLGIPQIKNLFAVQPFYFEGTHTTHDGQFDDAREHVALQGFLGPNPHGDFRHIEDPIPPDQRHPVHEEIQDKMSTDPYGERYHDLMERRHEHARLATMRWFGKAFAFRDFQRFIGEFQAAETRLVPNPFDQHSPSVSRGRLLFGDLAVGCVICHPPPHFTDKSEKLYHNHERVLPSLISFTDRELSFTLVGPHWMDTVNGEPRDVEYWEKGRVERIEGAVTSFSLRGLFDRPFVFLHHGRALSLRESFAAPDHYALRRFKYPPLRGGEEVRADRQERGFNELSFLKERTYMVDTHGATSHLNALQVQDLEAFLLSIE